MALETVGPIPMPDPTDLDAVAEYSAEALDPGGNNQVLRARIRTSLRIPVVDEQSRLEAAVAQIDIAKALPPRR